MASAIFKNQFYFLFLVFFKKEAECFFFLAPSLFLLGVQPSLRHPRGSSVPRTSTPSPVHGSRPGVVADILEAQGVTKRDCW
ncbi:hypothetical protein ERO13_A03G161800v2 [Gossypium hirsutum]|nr:hypothetical protein ERO13_A03G161800v2 [Gossypium hirsutum]KAG4208897.1 hypothetical protein ERO13_A03G161800v2 [Gossypium hirsutum]KAG4208898.1 hypothetical protein ERO13_A03G161800v2 [Gossypium hirsutum]KAG4208899.1 hypothetical protein ERO13_A03G161800v2 [Gossypium hirsutum]